LSRADLEDAARAVSANGAFRYTKRNLYYELVRRGLEPAPRGDPAAELRAFRARLAAEQATSGPLPGLIHLTEATRAPDRPPPPDVFDFAVRRVLVLDRIELFLLFALNGFHRRMEIALASVTRPRRGTSPKPFPGPVWNRLERQLQSNLRTAFYTMHDCNRRGATLRGDVKKLLVGRGRPLVADVGLTFAQAFERGIPVRRSPRRPPDEKALPLSSLDEEEALLLRSGSYAHLEELPPLALLRWAYARVQRGAEDLGFG
jgi:hypothetical protein